MAWAKIKIFWEHDITSFTATTTETGFSANNLLDSSEITKFKNTSLSDEFLTFDAGVGNTITADSIVINGHNFGTTGATITLQKSNDNFSANVVDIVSIAPSNDLTIIREFTSFTERYTRLKISGHSAVVSLSILYWGRVEELDFAFVSFDPNSERVNSVQHVTEGGFLSGVFEKFTERVINIQFREVENDLYTKISNWFTNSRLNNFGIAWEINEHSTDTWIVRPAKNFFFNNPLVQGGNLRNINLNLIGRKE